MEISSTAATVVYIGGYSRSGSTLLLRLLAEQPGFVAVGELFDIWDRSYIQNQLCGCGQGFRECPFWTDVTMDAFGCTPCELDAAELNKMRAVVQGHNRIPLLWHPELRSSRYQKRLADYASTLTQLYQSVHKVSGSGFIVDSSKIPQFAWVLAETPELELHVVHLVRDSRATAFSWQRERVRPEITSTRTYMERHSVLRSAAEWSLFNYLLRSRRRAFASYTLLRYEDLVADPDRALRKVLDAIGAPGTPVITPDESAMIDFRASHTASGNPGRFQVGKISVELDAEWMNSMSAFKRAVVTAITARGLARYGYPLRRRPKTG
jgi:hypothetical protein